MIEADGGTVALKSDPFTEVYKALWSLFDASPIRAGNKVDFTEPNPIKKTVQVADFPELRIEPVGGESTLTQTSDSTSITKEFEVLLSVASNQLRLKYFRYQFHVFCRLSAWKSVMGPLLWSGNPYVEHVNVSETTEGRRDTNQDSRRNISNNWSTLYVVSVKMTFSTAQLEGFTDV